MELNSANNTPIEQGQNSTETATAEEKTSFSREEVEALLQKETDRRVSQALATQERKNQARLREAEKLASMNAEERYKYQLEQKEQELIEREKALLLSENRAQALQVLADKGLSSSFIDFVVSETAEEMQSKINQIEKAFKLSVKNEVERRLGTGSPKASTLDNGQMTKEQFNSLSISQKQELYNNDRELYNSFVQK